MLSKWPQKNVKSVHTISTFPHRRHLTNLARHHCKNGSHIRVFCLCNQMPFRRQLSSRAAEKCCDFFCSLEQIRFIWNGHSIHFLGIARERDGDMKSVAPIASAMETFLHFFGRDIKLLCTAQWKYRKIIKISFAVEREFLPISHSFEHIIFFTLRCGFALPSMAASLVHCEQFVVNYALASSSPHHQRCLDSPTRWRSCDNHETLTISNRALSCLSRRNEVSCTEIKIEGRARNSWHQRYSSFERAQENVTSANYLSRSLISVRSPISNHTAQIEWRRAGRASKNFQLFPLIMRKALWPLVEWVKIKIYISLILLLLLPLSFGSGVKSIEFNSSSSSRLLNKGWRFVIFCLISSNMQTFSVMCAVSGVHRRKGLFAEIV
jgi:hypothetical protein